MTTPNWTKEIDAMLDRAGETNPELRALVHSRYACFYEACKAVSANYYRDLYDGSKSSGIGGLQLLVSEAPSSVQVKSQSIAGRPHVWNADCGWHDGKRA